MSYLWPNDYFEGSTNFPQEVVLEILNLAFFALFALFAQKGYFWWSEGYTLYRTLIQKCILRVHRWVNQLPRTSGSRDREFDYFWPFWPWIGPKKCVPLDKFWDSFQKLVIYDRMIILRRQRTFHKKWFVRYWIWPFLPFFALFAQKGYFRWSEGYKLYRTLIEKYLLRVHRWVNQLFTTSGSLNIEFGYLLTFLTLNWPKKMCSPG